MANAASNRAAGTAAQTAQTSSPLDALFADLFQEAMQPGTAANDAGVAADPQAGTESASPSALTPALLRLVAQTDLAPAQPDDSAASDPQTDGAAARARPMTWAAAVPLEQDAGEENPANGAAQTSQQASSQQTAPVFVPLAQSVAPDTAENDGSQATVSADDQATASNASAPNGVTQETAQTAATTSQAANTAVPAKSWQRRAQAETAQTAAASPAQSAAATQANDPSTDQNAPSVPAEQGAQTLPPPAQPVAHRAMRLAAASQTSQDSTASAPQPGSPTQAPSATPLAASDAVATSASQAPAPNDTDAASPGNAQTTAKQNANSTRKNPPTAIAAWVAQFFASAQPAASGNATGVRSATDAKPRASVATAQPAAAGTDGAQSSATSAPAMDASETGATSRQAPSDPNGVASSGTKTGDAQRNDPKTAEANAPAPSATVAQSSAPSAAAQPAAAATQTAAAASQSPAPNASIAAQPTTLHVAPQHDDTGTSVNMLGVAIAAKSQGGAKQFDIRLDPPELGRVDVRLSVDGNGNAQASLVVDKPSTLSLLQQDAPALNKALNDAGLNLSNNGLNFQLRDGQERQNDSGNSSRGRSRALSVKAFSGIDAATTTASTQGFASDGARLDIRV